MKNIYHLISFGILLLANCTPRTSIPSVPTNNEDFFLLNDKISTSFRYVNGSALHFLYNEDYNDQDGFLNYTIYAQDQQIVQSSNTQAIRVVYGVNKIKMPLSIIRPGYYILEVINEKGVKQYLTFQKA